MTNRDQDDKEEEWPEELDDQLDLHERRTWERLTLDQTLKNCHWSVIKEQHHHHFIFKSANIFIY